MSQVISAVLAIRYFASLYVNQPAILSHVMKTDTPPYGKNGCIQTCRAFSTARAFSSVSSVPDGGFPPTASNQLQEPSYGPLFSGDDRKMLDIGRAGFEGAVAGGAQATRLSAKLANSIGSSSKLQQTYTPIQVETVRTVDEARKQRRRLLRGTRIK